MLLVVLRHNCNACGFFFRSWDKVYTVLRGHLLLAYKDQKTSKSAPENYFKNEPPVDLRNGRCTPASDYTKKKHVFRLT